jgi:hypothetical protein
LALLVDVLGVEHDDASNDLHDCASTVIRCPPIGWG